MGSTYESVINGRASEENKYEQLGLRTRPHITSTQCCLVLF